MYRMSTDEGRRKKFAYGIEVSNSEVTITTNCDKCGQSLTKDFSRIKDNTVQYALTNDYFPDFMFSCFNKLISEKALSILQQNNISGYEIANVEVLSKDNLSQEQLKELRLQDGINIKKIPDYSPKYYRFFLGTGAILHSDVGIKVKEYCDKCGYVDTEMDFSKEYPWIIDKETYKGHDVFLVVGYGYTQFCSQKFFDVYKNNNLTGLLFEEVEVI